MRPDERGSSLTAFFGPMPHGGHDQFSPYLIDPLFTHHAILEDELRFTSTWDERKDGGTVWGTGIEVAYALTDAFGFEVFVPFIRMTDLEQPTRMGLGDLEVQALKWSFYRKSKLVVTGALGGIVPTGDAAAGLGDGVWAVEPHLFVDGVAGTTALQANLAYGFVEGGEQELEFSSSVAKIFLIGDTWSAGPLIELMGTRITRGDDSGSWEELGIAPGLKLQLGGWHFGLGVRLPLLDHEVSRRLVLATGGYHVSF